MTEKIREILLASGFGISETECDAFCRYAEFLVSENEKYNLTALTGAEDIAEKHFLDSLLSLKHGFEPPEGASVIDVGSGAGLPGIPLKIVRRDLKLTVLDATEKKVRFMSEAARIAGFEVNAVAARAEEAAARPPMREGFDCAVSRGVAALNVLCELCLPFVKVGGVFVAYKGRSAREELAAAENAVKTLGGEAERVEMTKLGDAERGLIFIRKVRPTPEQYPRSFGKIKKKPL